MTTDSSSTSVDGGLSLSTPPESGRKRVRQTGGRLALDRLTIIELIILALTALGAVGAYLEARGARLAVAPSTATFTSPADLARQECVPVGRGGLTVSGTATMVRSERLWLMLQAPGEGVFYLPSATAQPLSPGGEWSQPVTAVGSDSPDDSGQEFTIVLVAASLDADNLLRRTVNTDVDDGARLDAIPVGATVVAQGCLRRT